MVRRDQTGKARFFGRILAILIILLISYILKQTKSLIINLTSDNLEIVCNCNPMLMVYLQYLN